MITKLPILENPQSMYFLSTHGGLESIDNQEFIDATYQDILLHCDYNTEMIVLCYDDDRSNIDITDHIAEMWFKQYQFYLTIDSEYPLFAVHSSKFDEYVAEVEYQYEQAFDVRDETFGHLEYGLDDG